jgi:hypothetical protein
VRETTLADCAVLELRRDGASSVRGTSIEFGFNCPFPIQRVYHLFDVPAGAMRGGHAHRELHQLIVAVRGSFDVRLDDGRSCREVRLDRPDNALHLVPGIWRELLNFSAGSICLVIASELFDEADYFRDHADFLTFKASSGA